MNHLHDVIRRAVLDQTAAVIGSDDPKTIKTASVRMARLALCDATSAMLKVDKGLEQEETHGASKEWTFDVDTSKHVAAAINALAVVAHSMGLDVVEVLPQRTCSLCGRASTECRRYGTDLVCLLCRNDDDFDTRVKRVQRELAALSIEYGDAEDLGDRVLADLDIAPTVCDARKPHLPDARCILPLGHKANHYWTNAKDCKHAKFTTCAHPHCTACGVNKKWIAGKRRSS